MCTTPVFIREKKAENQKLVDLEKVGFLFVAVATAMLVALFSLFYFYSIDNNTSLIFEAGIRGSALVSVSFFGGWFFLKKQEAIN